MYVIIKKYLNCYASKYLPLKTSKKLPHLKLIGATMKVSKKHTGIKHLLTIKGCSEKVLDSISQQQIRELHEQ